tara:strand:+ start:5740 stop:6213 length:474 start_codon:yes stop_codon:yes gene_type:complete
MNYIIQIHLEHEKDIIRKIEICEDSNLYILHNKIVESLNLDQNQMASFYFTNEKLDLKKEIPLFNIDENENIEMSNIKIKSAFCNINDQLIYVYDFLKMWRFLVTYEKTSKSETEETKVIYSVGEMPKKAPDIIFKSENDSESSDDIFYDEEDQYLI